MFLHRAREEHHRPPEVEDLLATSWWCYCSTGTAIGNTETQDVLFLTQAVFSTMSLLASEPQSTETWMEQVTSKIFIQTPMSTIQLWLGIRSLTKFQNQMSPSFGANICREVQLWLEIGGSRTEPLRHGQETNMALGLSLLASHQRSPSSSQCDWTEFQTLWC